jgi:hypothetical protein
MPCTELRGLGNNQYKTVRMKLRRVMSGLMAPAGMLTMKPRAFMNARGFARLTGVPPHKEGLL